jgi:hypothetical protein
VILLAAKWSASLVKRLYGLCIFLIGIIGGFVSGTLLYATGVRILDYSGSFSEMIFFGTLSALLFGVLAKSLTKYIIVLHLQEIGSVMTVAGLNLLKTQVTPYLMEQATPRA